MDELIQVTIISRANQSMLVKWVDANGKIRLTYVMSSLIHEGGIPLEELELGIEAGAGWSYLLSGTEFSESAECISAVFEQAKITDWHSLQNAPRKVGHICGEDIYQIVATLNRLLKKE